MKFADTTHRSYLARIFILLAIPGVLFLGPEIAARLIGLDARWSLRPSVTSCTERSASLQIELIPNCTGNLRGTPLTTNSLGFRGKDVRDDGSRRVLTLGDSCTFGWMVKQDETYPAVLERLLNENQAPTGYQVINAGRSGWTAYHGRVLLEEKGLSLEPDIVTIAFGFNAMFKTGDIEERIKADAAKFALLRMDDILMNWSKAYAWARWKTRPRPSTDAELLKGRGALGIELMEPQETANQYEANLRHMVLRSQQSGAKVLLVSFWGTNPNDYLAKLSDISRDLNVPILSYQGPRFDVVHPTKEGYRVLGKQIFDTFEKNGWLE